MANKCNARTRFQRGANNVYSCGCCKRSTRGTGDAFGVRLCGECYELAGIENFISDHGIEEARAARYDAAAREELKKLTALGVDVAKVWGTLLEDIEEGVTR